MIYEMVRRENGIYLIPQYKDLYNVYFMMCDAYPVCWQGAGEWYIMSFLNYEDSIFIPTYRENMV